MVRILRDRRLLAAATVIGVLAAVALWPEAVPVDSVIVSRGPLEVTVDDEGRTRVRDRFVVSAPVTGRVLRLELEPGDRVRRGQVVARVQPGLPPLLDVRTRAEQEAAAESARAALGRAQAEAGHARVAAARADHELARSRTLAAAGAVAAQEVDAREAEARLAAEGAAAAGFAVRAAVAELQRTEAGLAPVTARAPGPSAAVTAPADGVILKRLRESESLVPAGEPLVEIGDTTRLEVVVDLLSTDALRVRPGARAAIEPLDGQLLLEGRVRRVEPSGFTKISALGVEEQRVNVILDLAGATQPDIVLGDAYRVEVRIVVWESPSVVKVPTSALFRDGTRWAVYEVRQGRAARVVVELGRQTGREAEVVSGLSEGATVIIHPGDRIVDGARVENRKI